MNPYTIEQTSRNVVTVRFKKVSKGWEQWVLLRSDAHHDNIHCNRDLETAHLKKAKERGALIIDAGDLFCAMIETPDVVKSLANKVRALLTEFFDEWFKRYGTRWSERTCTATFQPCSWWASYSWC